MVAVSTAEPMNGLFDGKNKIEAIIKEAEYTLLHKSITIKSEGRSEVRVFISLYSLQAAIDGDRIFPLLDSNENDGDSSQLQITLIHVLPEGEFPYSSFIVKPDSTSSISGYHKFDIIGNEFKIMIEANNCPLGKYTLVGTTLMVR